MVCLLGFLQEEFEEYAQKALTLPESTSNENKLILYALFKQSTVGPVNTSRPGMLNMRERAKWDAWKTAEGVTVFLGSFQCLQTTRTLILGFWFCCRQK
ncbi:Acyl-CoA-binding protein [Linum perenne]